ncbi:hypothetical protein Tco_0825508, partial [Tanacetum coccineum]
MFRTAKTSLNTEGSDSDDEEGYGIQRNNFRALVYGPKPSNDEFGGKPKYMRNHSKKEEGDEKWHAEIRLSDPYGNVYDQVMDPNSSVGKTCLGENIIDLSSEKTKGHGAWNSLEYQDTTNNGAYDGEINLGKEENMISNEFAVKLCLDHEVKCGHKVVKKELIVALRGEINFVKFIINIEEDDVEPRVVLGRSFMHLTKGIDDFRNGVITIYLKLDPFLDRSGEIEKIDDDWDLLLDDLDFGDIPEIEGEEAAREALAIDICRRFAILEEERPVIETMTYSDKYKKILDEICIDKMKLDGEMKKEEEKAKVKGEALIKKEDTGAFVIPIRLEAKINLHALGDTGSDINVMPYRVYKELSREELKNVNRGITTLNHSKAGPIGLLKDVLCQ